jgi:hypothetical protein
MGVLLQGFFKTKRTTPSRLLRMVTLGSFGGGSNWRHRRMNFARQVLPQSGCRLCSRPPRATTLGQMGTAFTMATISVPSTRRVRRLPGSPRASNCSVAVRSSAPMHWTFIWTWSSISGLVTPRHLFSDIPAPMVPGTMAGSPRILPTFSRRFRGTQI